MNTTTEHDRHLAVKLKSLSLEPVAFEIEPSKRSARRFAIRIIAISLTATASLLVFALYRPDAFERLETILFARPGTTDASTASTDEAGVQTDRSLAAHQVEPTVRQDAVSSTREVAGSGYVTATNYTTVFSKYEGKIVKVAVDVGDRVAAGQVLVTLDDAGTRFAFDEAVNAKVSAELALAARTIDLEQARSALARSEVLAARKATSQQQIEDEKTVWERAMNSVAQAKHDLVKADLDIQKAREHVHELTILAPIAGTITRLNARVGDSVLARADSVRENDSLLTITDTTNMVIDADVAEANIALMRRGLRGEAVLDSFPDQPFKIEVKRIAPTISMEKGTVAVRLTLFSPPIGIRPNMAARISIAVPKNAVATNQQGAEQ